MASEDRYDRQTRLWGTQGQFKLKNSKVLLLGGSPVGVETLKNLVLPGIGHITIVDNQTVTSKDTKNNFFTPISTIGEPRAKVIQELLCELNPDVKGDYIIDQPQYINIQGYDLVVANEFSVEDSLEVSRKSDQYKINLIYVNTQGFMGKLRLQAHNHFIVESRPMGRKTDLRILKPFEYLNEFFEEYNLQTLSPLELAHVPYPVILRKALNIFMQQNEGRIPTTFKEKDIVFSQIIRDMSKCLPEELRENFFEAIFKGTDAVLDFSVSSVNETDEIMNLLTLFDDKRCGNSNHSFWLMIEALKYYVEQDNQLPLSHVFPDMKCTTQTYVRMKNKIYGRKCQEDFIRFKSIVDNIILKRQLSIQIEDEEMTRFIDNIPYLRIIDYRSYEKETSIPLKIEDTETDIYKWYIAIRSSQLFIQQNKRIYTVQDLDQLQELCNQVAHQLGVEAIEYKYMKEIVNFQNSQIHTIASVIGGMASQEAVKLLTKQFIPINNTLIFNGLNGEAAVFQF